MKVMRAIDAVVYGVLMPFMSVMLIPFGIYFMVEGWGDHLGQFLLGIFTILIGIFNLAMRVMDTYRWLEVKGE